MKISVITVCFNSEKTIADTIDSVLAQTYADIEYIIVDGASSDGTASIIQQYGTAVTHFISEPDKGIYDAMNKGVRAATGDVICILNSDDIYIHNNVIANIAEEFNSHSNTDIIFGDLEFRSADLSTVVRVCRFRYFRPLLLRFGWMPPHPATFVRRHLYDDHGLYSLDYTISSDYEIFVRWLMVNKASWKHIPGKLISMRVGGASTASLRSSLRLNLEIVKACKENGIYTNIVLVLLKIPFKLMELRRTR